MKKILIIGGCGFVGSHLVELLARNPEHEIFLVDSGVTSFVHPAIFVKQLPPPFRTRIFVGTLESYLKATRDYFGNHWRYDAIFHLASVVGPARVIAQSGTIAQNILMDTLRLARMAERTKATLVDVSTSEVYGGGVGGFCQEKMESHISHIPSARLEYAVGKLAAEIAVRNMAIDQGLDVRIVRPFNIAGPRQRPAGGFVLPRFCLQALLSRPLTVFGDGSQQRALTHVEDIVEGLEAVWQRGEAGGVYNLGNPKNRVTMKVLAEEVIKVAGSASPLTFVDPTELYGARYAAAADKWPDIVAASQALSWTPKRDLETVIVDTLAYWQGMTPEIWENEIR